MSDLREDFIVSAVAFLKDPQVSSAALAKKIEFLESKELNPAEIQEALRRANGSEVSASTTATVNRPPPLPSYSHVLYAQQQPPALPKRDWKDYFIMATASVGVTYAIYEVAKRYVLPLVLPPSPEILEASTAELEEQFKSAQALLDKLQQDNEELKKCELESTKRVEEMIAELEQTMKLVENHIFQGDKDMDIVKQQVESVRASIPKEFKEQNDIQSEALREVLDDLKTLRLTLDRSRQPPPPPKSTNPPQIPGLSNYTTSTNSVPAPSVPSTSAAVPAVPAPVTSLPHRSIPAWQQASANSAR